MLTGRPAVLNSLLERYERLRVMYAEGGSSEVRQRMDDIARTLCTFTGTKDFDSALLAVRSRHPGNRAKDEPLLVN
ncbi:DUF5133 domain-containing protein [Streptomyces sp. NPDC006326]|uniref:DUF5133 domain-containing protein n=1 Tax=Streptomyces sp. NPDC006326 TaxID=3156752 RepID=UPI0033BB3A7A